MTSNDNILACNESLILPSSLAIVINLMFQRVLINVVFLQHYQGDVSDLELYFVIVNNEYGEQTEEELLPGGKNTPVTNDNVIPFIHLVANHRLNYQVTLLFMCIGVIPSFNLGHVLIS